MSTVLVFLIWFVWLDLVKAIPIQPTKMITIISDIVALALIIILAFVLPHYYPYR